VMSARRHLCAIGLLVTLGALPEPQPGGVAWTDAQIARLRENVDAALEAPALRGAYVGVFAIDTVRGAVLYSRNADDEFTPGSELQTARRFGCVAVSRSGFSVRDDALKRRAAQRRRRFWATSICTAAATRI